MSATRRDRGFHPYDGVRTPQWARFLVITRYALLERFGKKKMVVALVASVVWPLIAASIVYLHHNAEALNVLQLPVAELIPINESFFLRILKVQAVVAFFLTLIGGATLISVDQRDNAMPLYLGRPISRFEYVLGKFMVLFILCSIPTWVMGLMVYGLQVSLAGLPWLKANLAIGFGLLWGSWALIVLLALVCLAISAAMRAKAAAEVVFGSFFIALPIMGAIIDKFLKTDWGTQLNLPVVFDAVWRPMFGMGQSEALSFGRATFTIVAICALAVVILRRRVKAYEVVK